MQDLGELRAGVDGAPLTIVLPLLPGQSEPWRRFLQELQASRRAAFDAACRRWGICSLELWLAPARTSDLVVAQLVLAGDLAEAEERFARSRQPFDQWIADRVRELHGVDLRYGVGRYRAERLGVWIVQESPREQGEAATAALPGALPGDITGSPPEE